MGSERHLVAIGLVGSALGILAACIDDGEPPPPRASSSSGGGEIPTDRPDAAGSSSGGGSSSSGGSGDSDGAAPDAGSALGDVAGLALWLEADDLTVGTPAARWPDRSPNHNDANVVGSVPNVIGGNDTIGGHLAVRFDAGQGLQIVDHPSLQFDDTGFLIEVVERHPGIVDDETDVLEPLFEKSAAGVGLRLAIAYRPTPEHPAYVRGELGSDAGVRWPLLLPPSNVGLRPIAPHLVTLRLRSGGVLSVRGDDAEPQTAVVTVPANLAAAGAHAFLGARTGAAPLKADIAAMVVVRAPDDATVARVDRYLRARFGFTPLP